MLYLRIWSDAAGETHLERMSASFEQVDGYTRNVPSVGISRSLPVGETHFLRLPPGWLGDFHPAPTRQYLSQLSGEIAVTMSDGTTIKTAAGTLWLIEDVEGKGHRTEVVSDEDTVFFVVTAAEP